MPIEIDDTYIIINDGSTTSNILEVVKSRLTTQGDEIANDPTITNEQLYRSQLIPATQYNYTNVYPSLDADATNLVAWYKFDGDFTDSSGNDNHLIKTGVIETSNNKALIPPESLYSDESMDYKLSFPATIDLRNTDLTISLWFYINQRLSGQEILVFKYADGTNAYYFYTRDNGYRIRTIWEGPNGNNDMGQIGSVSGSSATVGYAFNINQWYLHTFVLTNSEIKEYINGELIETRTGNVAHYTTSFSDMYIGKLANSHFSGNIDDLRIYNKALTPSEIDILANLKVKTYVEPVPLLRLMENDKPKYKLLTFTYDNNLVDYPVLDVDSTNLVAWFKFDGDLTNSIANSITATSGGTNDVTFNDSKVNGTSSAKAHTNKFIKLNNFNPYNTWSSGSGITFSMWVKMDNLSSYVYDDRNQRIFSIASVANSGDTTSPNRTHQLGIWRTNYDSTRTLTFYHNNGTSVESYQTNSLLRDSTWFHLVWSIDSNGDWGIYIDGVDQNVNITLSLNNNPHELVFIGGDIALLDGSAYPIYFDDFRIYDKALSAAEITDLYNQYFQAKYQLNFSNDAECDILIVAGGGSGGVDNGAGGGGGGVLYAENITLNGDYIIKVGDGGKKSFPTSGYQPINSGSGFSSMFGKTNDMLEVFGGGYGGNADNSGTATYVHGADGGSGGGGIYNNGIGGSKKLPTYNSFITSANSFYYGGDGGDGIDTSGGYNLGGGGGGASGIKPIKSDGADGVQIDIDGNNYYWGGGGGGIVWQGLAGSGGKGGGGGAGGYDNNGGKGGANSIASGKDGTGGGAAGAPTGVGGSGAPGTGGGGGGDAYSATEIGGGGGSGIVMIRYKIDYQENQHDAQWTHSSSDASVYHLGNVGIGAEASSAYSLNVAGDINVNGDIYMNNTKINTSTHSTYVHDNDPVVYNDNIRTLPVYDNFTDTLQKAAEEVSGVKGWRLVRFLPGTATAWHPVNDNLVGTTTYGTAYDYSNAFSVEFGEFDEFMFSNGNMRNWLHATRDQVIGQTYDNAQRTIIKSSKSSVSYKARWYNRSNGHDPLITIEDWSVSSSGDKHGVLYIENSYNGHEEYFGNSGGMCVFVRKYTDTISSVATDYTHKYLFFNYNNYYESTFSYYTVHNINFPVDTQCDVLVVGGGGSGGGDQGGGGGAGGLVYLDNITLKGDYSLVVGKGGAQASATNTNNGYSSYFNKSRLSTYEDDNFEDYANGIIYGELTNIQNNTYYITLSNGIQTRLTGWTHTRIYASGFLRNIDGDAFLIAYNLKPGETYDFATYCNNTAASENRDSYFNVNGGDTITVKQRLTKQPTYVGHAVADSNGEIIFKFWRSAGHIHFSGISISLNEGKYTAIYGGGGGRFGGTSNTSTHYGSDGGSGGGGGNGYTFGITAGGGDSIQDQYLDSQGNRRGWGFAGGNGLLNSYSGGVVSAGGGGAGAAGGDVINTTTAGDGGDGKEIGITGIMTYYAGGGGGGSQSDNGGYGGEGGLGGGGHGGQTQNLYVASSTINKYKDGLPHTGSGGGGVRSGGTNSGAGGSGVIIIRYAVGNRITTLSDWKYSRQYDDVYYMGNVAIGKTNPTIPFDVFGDFVEINGDVVATSKSFKIEHPVVSNMYLYHGCIEGPRFDNIYRGKKLVVDGYCEVDIDSECNSTGGMTPGTFVALNDDPQLYLQNNQTFDKVRGYIENGKIKIYCINTTENIMVDWLVIGERRDKDVIKNAITNASGKLICEQ